MPRKARNISSTKVYHIIFRGNDKQDIFFDKQDYKKFIKEIKRTKETYKYELYAYCLMSNHIHLIIYDQENQLSKAMQSLAITYSSYFSQKYDKVGHLFQNRFLSRNVENKEYLIHLVRYIHQNPLKAKIEKTEKYKWSSYNEFISKEKLTDTKLILSFFGTEKEKAIENFVKFHRLEEKEANYAEYEIINRLTDERAKQIVETVLGIDNIIKLKNYNSSIIKIELKKLKEIKGTTISQLSRITGINRKIIERAMK